MKHPLEGATVIGGARALDAGLDFQRARVVLRLSRGGGALFIVHRYPEPGIVEGESLDDEEWKELQMAEEAFVLDVPMRPTEGGVLWLLGRGFPRSYGADRELAAVGALLGKAEMSGTEIVLVNEVKANALRLRWGDASFESGWRSAERADWPNAVRSAERAFAIAGMSPERVALLCLAYERGDRKVRSEGYLEMARRSRDAAFYNQTREKLEEYRRACPTAIGLRRTRHDGEMETARKDALRKAERQMSCATAA
jgi:hypothetical protein